MKKIIAILVALSLVATMAVTLSACNKKDDNEETTVAGVADETTAQDETEADVTQADNTETEDTTAAEETPALPGPGETADIGGAKVVVPEGWTVTKLEDGDVRLAPDGANLENVELQIYPANFGKDAAGWAEAINKNYGGNCEKETVEIGGVNYILLHALEEQNMLFTDLSNGDVLEIAVMMMPYGDAVDVLAGVSYSD